MTTTTSHTSQTVSDSQANLQRLLYWLAFFLGLAWVIVIGAQSTGTPADDEITHVLVARWAWQYPEFILDIWMRVANTLLYMIPSLAGLGGLRAFSLGLTAVSVLLATGIGQRLGVRWLALIPLLMWFQPWIGDLSYTGIKSIPFMFLLTAGVYLWLLDRHVPAALLIGCLPLSRHEGIALLGLWFLYMLVCRKWSAALACWLPMVVYNAAYWLAFRPSLEYMPFYIYFRPEGSGYYGSGAWWHFFPPVVVGAGIPVLIWSLLGLWPTRKLGQKAVWLLLPAAYFGVHTVIYLFGLYESGGYGMFLLPLAPAFALLAAFGVEALWRFLSGRFRRERLILALLIPSVALPVIYTGLITVRPRYMNEAEQTARVAADWLAAQPFRQDVVYSSYPWVNMFYGTVITPEKKHVTVETVKNLPPDAVLLWDSKYSDFRGFTREVLASMGWVEVTRFGTDIVVYRR